MPRYLVTQHYRKLEGGRLGRVDPAAGRGSGKIWRLFVILPVFARAALATEHFAGFAHLNQPATADTWGPVQTEKASVANLAPVLLPYFNNGPVFGLPGTEVGDFWHRTQLTGDWGGVRTDLARPGFFFDPYTTSAYQNVTSGGLRTGGAFVQNLQLSMDLSGYAK